MYSNDAKGIIFTSELPKIGSSIYGTVYSFLDRDRTNPFDLDEGKGIVTTEIKRLLDVTGKGDTFLIETKNSSIYMVRVYKS